MKKVDKNYCMNSFLTFRYVDDKDILFKDGLEHELFLEEKYNDKYDILDYKDVEIHLFCINKNIKNIMNLKKIKKISKNS